MGAPTPPYGRSAAVGFAVAVGQLAFVLAASWAGRQGMPDAADRTVRAAYEGLANWDTGWYLSIAKDGYHTPDTLTHADFGNVSFFPGYPLAARGFHAATGVAWPCSFLIISQLACGIAWTYLLLLLRAAGVAPRGRAVVVGLLLCHPAAFYLVVGYSEALFLACFLGMCHWAGRPGWTALALAAAHGFAMTATRIIGLPLVAVPLVAVWFAAGSRWRDLWRPTAVAVVAAAGTVSFFAWCHVRFGRWDLYFLTEEAGWGIRPNYGTLFTGRQYVLQVGRLMNKATDPHPFDQMMATVVLVCCYLTAAAEAVWAARGGRGWRQRMPWYAATAATVYVPLAGQWAAYSQSFTRYCHTAAVPFLIAWAIALAQSRWRAWAVGLLVVLAAAGLAYQAAFAALFGRGLAAF